MVLLGTFEAVVGRLGTAQLGGVGIASLITVVLQSAFSFLAVLATPAVARAAAQEDDELVGRTLLGSPSC